MSRVIIDIETIAKDFDSFDKGTQDYLLRWAKTEEEIEEAKENLSLYPLTGEIVCIGMLNPDSGRGAIYFQSPKEPFLPFEEEGIRYQSGGEKEILEWFWNAVKRYDQIITFNGRAFDCPFIIIRSAVHRLRPTRDLMPRKYNGSHIDLLEQLTFYGASRRKFSLDMWCKTFGIKSPKESGITGSDVRELFAAGRYTDIARYCLGDLIATKELFEYWEKYIKFSLGF